MFRSAELAVLSVVVVIVTIVSSCSMTLGEDGFYVNGFSLEEKHEETLDVQGWDAAGLAIEASCGDVTVRGTDGPSRIVAMVHEVEPGDGRLVYEGGRLIAVTASGDPAAIGDVDVYLGGPIPSLAISSGAGDIECENITVDGPLVLSTGMGDVCVEEVRTTGRLELDSGMGDLRAVRVDCASIRANTGMGDVILDHVSSTAGNVSSGMGDVKVEHGRFDRLDASTGLGDLVCRHTAYETGHLDTGLGDLVSD